MPIYSKPALSSAQILHHLWSRGLRIDDRQKALIALESIGYYRLLIYMRTFQGAGKRFYSGTKFSDILSIYEFDKKIRLHLVDALERVEVAMRVALSDHMSSTYSPHWYMNSNHYKSFDSYARNISKINNDLGIGQRGKSVSLNHYYATYSDPELPPSWLVMERLSFGQLSRLFECLNTPERKVVARPFGFDEQILTSWLHSLTFLRNVCAHHSRVWNVKFSKFTPKSVRIYSGEFLVNDRLYVRALVIWLLLRSQPSAIQWRDDLVKLIAAAPHSPATTIGFQPGWETGVAWQ